MSDAAASPAEASGSRSRSASASPAAEAPRAASSHTALSPPPRATDAGDDEDEDDAAGAAAAADGSGGKESEKAASEAGDDDGAGDAAAEKPASGTGKGKAKIKPGEPHSWQAIWAPAQSAYYFWNAETNETTWENPLEVDESAAAGSSAAATQAAEPLTDEQLALSAGIDPDLAYLDPTLYSAQLASARAGAASGPYGAAGAFDARTGRFVPAGNLGAGAINDPSRLSQVARAGRQMEVFFDVAQYEQQRAQDRLEEGDGPRGGKRKLSKKELEFYQQRKREKKAKRYLEN